MQKLVPVRAQATPKRVNRTPGAKHPFVFCFSFIKPFTLKFNSTFPQPFKEKCISEVVRIGNVIIFHLSKLWKAKFFIQCGVIFLVMLQGNFKLITLGSERVDDFSNIFGVQENWFSSAMRIPPHVDCTQSLSFLVHSNWGTGASESHSRADNGEEGLFSSLFPILRAVVSRVIAYLARSSISITKRKEGDCVQSAPHVDNARGIVLCKCIRELADKALLSPLLPHIESFSHDLERTKTKRRYTNQSARWSKQGNAIICTYLYLLVITCINYPMKSRVWWDWPIRSMWWREPRSFGRIDCRIVNFACCFPLKTIEWASCSRRSCFE